MGEYVRCGVMLGLERRNIEQALETVHLTAHKDKLVKKLFLWA